MKVTFQSCDYKGGAVAFDVCCERDVPSMEFSRSMLHKTGSIVHSTSHN